MFLIFSIVMLIPHKFIKNPANIYHQFKGENFFFFHFSGMCFFFPIIKKLWVLFLFWFCYSNKNHVK